MITSFEANPNSLYSIISFAIKDELERMKNQLGINQYNTKITIDPTVNQLHEFLRVPTYDYYLLKIKYHPLFNLDEIA